MIEIVPQVWSIAVSNSNYQCNSSQRDRIVVGGVREEVVMRVVRAVRAMSSSGRGKLQGEVATEEPR